MAEYMTGALIVIGLAVLRFGGAALVTWLLGRALRRLVPASA